MRCWRYLFAIIFSCQERLSWQLLAFNCPATDFWSSLVPRPLPQLLSLAVRKSRRRPGRVSHVMQGFANVIRSRPLCTSTLATIAYGDKSTARREPHRLIQARSLTFEVVLSCKCCTFQSDGGMNSQSASCASKL